MDNKDKRIMESFCNGLNQVKKSGLTLDLFSAESFLGGDLGIDSIEMLEIWFELEKDLGVVIDDAEKRDVYTVGEVVAVVRGKL